MSTRSPAVKRILREVKELHDPTDQYYAAPLEDNLFEWHFTVRGPDDSDFAGGIYHGRILLPPEYPLKPPSIILLTPNGRFQVGTKICLTISAHHPEFWQPSWSIRTVLLAIISFMPTKGDGAIGALDYTPAERQALAKRSVDWACPHCGLANRDALRAETKAAAPSESDLEAMRQLNFKGKAASESEGGAAAASASAGASTPASPAAAAEPSTTPAAAPERGPASPSTTASAAATSANTASTPAAAQASLDTEIPGLWKYNTMIAALAMAIFAILFRAILAEDP